MAYLRGNTFVDGDFNVQGSLVVNAVTTSSGNVPYYTSTGKIQSTIPIIDSSDGRLSTSGIKVDRDGEGVYAGVKLTHYVCEVNGDGTLNVKEVTNRFLLNNSGTLCLNKETKQWEFI